MVDVPVTVRSVVPFVFPPGSSVQRSRAACALQPRRLVTNATAPGQMTIRGIQFDGHTHLLAELDAYQVSLELQNKLVAEFYRVHGLTRKSEKAIDRWCDKHELYPPQIGGMMFPALKAGALLAVTAENRTPEPLIVAFWCWADASALAGAEPAGGEQDVGDQEEASDA